MLALMRRLLGLLTVAGSSSRSIFSRLCVNKAWSRDLEVELICSAQYFVVSWCDCVIVQKNNLLISLPLLTQQQSDVAFRQSQATTCETPHKAKSMNLFKVSVNIATSFTYLISNNTNLRTESKIWVPLFLVSMDHRVLDTQLHTRFTIFLYALRLETAMLTKHVLLDAADAERFVLPQANTCLQVQRRPARQPSSFYTDQ
jgi:hypothetical protein